MPQADFRELSPEAGREVHDRVVERFVKDTNFWWWEAFKLPHAGFEIQHGRAYRALNKLLPAGVTRAWLIAEDEYADFYPVYDAGIGAIGRVLGECPRFEYLCRLHGSQLVGW